MPSYEYTTMSFDDGIEAADTDSTFMNKVTFEAGKPIDDYIQIHFSRVNRKTLEIAVSVSLLLDEDEQRDLARFISDNIAGFPPNE